MGSAANRNASVTMELVVTLSQVSASANLAITDQHALYPALLGPIVTSVIRHASVSMGAFVAY